MRWRTLVGTLLIAGAIGQVAIAGVILIQTRDAEARAKHAWSKADDLCLEALRSVGEVTVDGPFVNVRKTMKTNEDWRVALMDASSTISYCTTRQMVKFCMGKGCGAERSGTEVTKSLENQPVTPSLEKILEAQPVRIEFRMMEIKE